MAADDQQFPWYRLASGLELQQGDIISNCPVVLPVLDATGGVDVLDTEVRERTGIVLSQSCDLAMRPDGRRHLNEVVFCAVYSRAELANHPTFGRSTAWEEARKGRLPAYQVLNRCELAGHERDFLLADFTRVFTVDIRVVRELARRQSPRLSLNPPYREHLAQAFARFFMRVGLPVDIPRFT